MHFNLAKKCDRTKGSLTHIENPSVEEFGGKFPDIGLKETSLQPINQECYLARSIRTFLWLLKGRREIRSSSWDLQCNKLWTYDTCR